LKIEESQVRSHKEVETFPGIILSTHNSPLWYFGSFFPIFMYSSPVSGGGGDMNNCSIKGTTLEISAHTFACYHSSWMERKSINQSIEQSNFIGNWYVSYILNKWQNTRRWLSTALAGSAFIRSIEPGHIDIIIIQSIYIVFLMIIYYTTFPFFKQDDYYSDFLYKSVTVQIYQIVE